MNKNCVDELFEELRQTYTKDNKPELNDEVASSIREMGQYKTTLRGSKSQILSARAVKRYFEAALEHHCILARVAELEGNNKIRDNNLAIAKEYQTLLLAGC